jgi:hypothetical protein
MPGATRFAQPEVGEHVVAHDLVEDLVAEAGHRPEVGVGGGVADEAVDPAPGGEGGVDEVIEVLFAGDVGGDGEGLVAFGSDRGGDGLDGLGFAAGDDDAGAGAGELLGDRAADAAAGAGDHRDVAAEVEERGGHGDATMPGPGGSGKGSVGAVRGDRWYQRPRERQRLLPVLAARSGRACGCGGRFQWLDHGVACELRGAARVLEQGRSAPPP